MNDYSDPKAQYRNKRSGQLWFAQRIPSGFPNHGHLLCSLVVRNPNQGVRDYTIAEFEARFEPVGAPDRVEPQDAKIDDVTYPHR